VRDLWALRLQVVATMLPENLPTSQPTSRATSLAPSRAASRVATDDEGGYSSQASSNYLYTSDSDVASTTYSSRRRQRQQRVVKARDRPKLIELLALCYLGLQLLRSAVSLGDFHRWADSQQLTYTRAIRAVPEAMREKLSAEYYTALEPMTRLAPGRLARTVHEMVVLLHSSFGLAFPPVNRDVLLIRAIHDLGLPLEIYAATKRLAERLFMTFEWPPLASTRRSTHWPEAKILALVIAAVKLCYGLDGIKRTPYSAAEPAATALEWGAWERFLRGGNTKRGGKLEGTAGRQMLQVDVKEADVFGMSPEELDWYLDWYEKTWCAEDGVAGGSSSKGGFLLF
jgi:RNA polymerase I-specific transcription initiation factor RRN7